MNALVVGDLHAMVNNLEDTGLIFDLIEQEAVKRKVSKIIFLGDLFHTHAVIRQEVAHFYQERFRRLTKLSIPMLYKDLVIVTGNHDGESPSSITQNACALILGHLANVVTEPHVDTDFVYVPFMYDNDKFVEVANAMYEPGKTLVCHQTFKGAAYESGMPIPEGVDWKLLKFEKIISGHIHMQQIIGSVWYVGTPRAVTAGEANDPKYIFHLVDGNSEKIPTGHLVKEYKKLTFLESAGIIKLSGLSFKEKDDVRVVISGSEAFYEAFVDANKDVAGKVKFIPDITRELGKVISIDESTEDFQSALKTYIFDVADIDKKYKGKVWERVQKAIRQ